MAVRKISVSLSIELADAVDLLALRRDEDRSRLIETLLRENPLTAAAIDELRRRPSAPPAREQAGHRTRLVVRGTVEL